MRTRQGQASAGREVGPHEARSLRRTWAYAVVAFFWPLADDAPVNLDAILGPNGHGLMEILLKILMLVFSFLAVREASKGAIVSWRTKIAVAGLVLLALLLANFDDLAVVIGPLHFSRQPYFWDPANALTKVTSIVALYRAVKTSAAS